MTATIAPGQSAVFHTHAFLATACVLEGTFTCIRRGHGGTSRQACHGRAARSADDGP